MATQTNREAILRVKFQVDKASIQQSQQALAQLRDGAAKDMQTFDKGAKNATQSMKLLNAEVAKVGRQNALDQLTKEAIKAGRASKDWEKALRDVEKRLRAIGATEGEISQVGARIGQAAGERGRLSPTLAGLGREVRALPAIAVPGAGGLTTDALGKVTAALASLPPVALPVLGVLVAIGAGFVALEASMTASKKALNEAVASNEFYFSEVRRLTTEENKARLAEIQGTLADRQAELANLQNAQAGEFEAAVQKYGDAGARLLFGLGQLSSADDGLAARQDELSKEITELSGQEAALTRAREDGSTATADAAAFEERLAAARLKAIQQAIALDTEVNRLTREGTTDQVQARIDAINDEQRAIVENIGTLIEEAQHSEEARKALDAANARLAELGEQTRVLTGEVLPLVQAREEEAKKLKDTADAVKKFNDDVTRIEQQAAEARAAAADRYLDAVTKAAEAAADAAEKALEKLQERRADLAAKLAQDETDAQAELQRDRLELAEKIQEDEAKAARKHANTLLQIRKDAEEKEFDLVLNRDFAGLFNLRRDTARRLDEANQSFQDEREERRLAAIEQLQDLQENFEVERQQRFAKYQRDIADAQNQYNRELRQAEVNRNRALQLAAASYQRELQLANEKYNREIQARQAAITAELQLIQQGGQARLALEAQIQQALVRQAQAILNAVSGGATQAGATASAGGGRPNFTPTALAGGGMLRAFQPAFVNEGFKGQRESFNGMRLPGGMGLFIPSQAGRVAPGGGRAININAPLVNMSVTSGGTPAQNAQLASMVEARVYDVLERITASA